MVKINIGGKLLEAEPGSSIRDALKKLDSGVAKKAVIAATIDGDCKLDLDYVPQEDIDHKKALS